MLRLLLAALLLTGCTKEPLQGSLLMSQVKQALADRDARLGNYRLEAQTTQGAEVGTHAFYFRSPNKLRAVMRTPLQFEWSFDGQRLYKLDTDAKKFSTFELKLPHDKASALLNTTFAPFVREGFRAPLMPLKGVTATLVTHPKGPQAVELKVEPGEGVVITYVLRWPSADFLERRTQAGAVASRLEVVEEQCEKLCVPKSVTEAVDGKTVLTMKVTALELDADLGAELFAPAVPEGWTSEVRQLVEQ